MADADDLQALAFALRRLDDERQRQQQEIADLRRQLAALVDLLVSRGTLTGGHRRTLERAASAPAERKVRLRVYVDKYAMRSPDVDCAALFPLCGARCCRLRIELTADDVSEGLLRWDLEQPYLLAKHADGLCVHLDRATGGCGVYDVRPATCREYDCRKDKRVWLDFDARIPAPLPDALDWPG